MATTAEYFPREGYHTKYDFVTRDVFSDVINMEFQTYNVINGGLLCAVVRAYEPIFRASVFSQTGGGSFKNRILESF